MIIKTSIPPTIAIPNAGKETPFLRFVERLHIIHRKFNRGVGIGSTKFILDLHYGLYDLYWSESMPVGGAISVDFAAMSRLPRDPR